MLTLVVLGAVRHAVACTAAFLARLDAAIDSTRCGCCQRLLSVRIGVQQKLHNLAMFHKQCHVESGQMVNAWTYPCFGGIRFGGDEEFADIQVTLSCCNYQTCQTLLAVSIDLMNHGKPEISIS